MISQTIVKVFDDVFTGQLHIVIRRYENGKTYVAESTEIKWHEVEPGEFCGKAWLSFDVQSGREFVRQIAAYDQLAEPGADLRAHLKDMRALVGKYAGVAL